MFPQCVAKQNVKSLRQVIYRYIRKESRILNTQTTDYLIMMINGILPTINISKNIPRGFYTNFIELISSKENNVIDFFMFRILLRVLQINVLD
jgi:hypothetical protein